MSGVYVHFPYCQHRCTYCDFALTTPKAIPAARYTDALLAEWAWRKARGETPARAKTVYIGGGTPSLWPVEELARFLAVVPRVEAAEVTIEANPEQCKAPWVEAVTALGVNRISLGVQSLDDTKLKQLTRAHGVHGARHALDVLQKAHAGGRLTSFSVDLIYGLDGHTPEGFCAEAERLIEGWGTPHLSLYALTVEPRTILARDIRRGVTPEPDSVLQAEIMGALRERLACYGFLHYEVSSWAMDEEHIARHNSAYWDMTPYVGLGAGAHGYFGGRRWSNIARPSRYVDRMSMGDSPEATSEIPDDTTRAFERLMTGLRRLDIGVEWGHDFARFEAGVAAEMKAGRLRLWRGRLHLTDQGLFVMDDVLANLVPERATTRSRAPGA